MRNLASLFTSVSQTQNRRFLVPGATAPQGGPPPSEPPPPAPGVATTFDALYAGDFALDQSTTYLSKPAQTKPSTKATSLSSPSYTDSRFGTKIFRMTSVADASSTSTHMRHEYSRRQCFNADSTKFFAVNTKGHWWLYDAATFARLDGGCTRSPDGVGALGVGLTGFYFRGDCEPMWHPTDPNKIWVTEQDGVGNIFYEFDIVTKTSSVLFDLNPLLSAIGWGHVQYTSFLGEGRPSNDGRWWGMSCMNNATNTQIGFIKYDRQTNTIVDYVACANKPNNITTSPSGAYVVPSWCIASGQTMAQCAAITNIEQANGTRAYYNGFDNFTQINEYGHHGDVASDAYGNDVWSAVNYNSALMPDVSDGYLYYRRLDTGVAYDLPVRVYSPSISAATHTSGVAIDRPGWIVVETYAGSPGATWNDEVVMAIELKPTTQKVYRLAHHQSIPDSPSGYWYEPHTTVNRDLTRVVYASDYNSATPGICESYMIGLPSWAIPAAGLIAVSRLTNPTISGTATTGSTLTRTLGTYDGMPAPTVTGIWQTSPDGTTWTDAAGFTGATSPVLGANGTQYRWGNEVATQAGGGTTSAVNSNVAIVANLAAPANTVAPSIASASSDAVTTNGDAGTWTGNPVPSYAYMWERNISGTWTDSGFTTINAILNIVGTWRLRVTATNSQGSAQATSNTCTVTTTPTFRQVTANSSGALTTGALAASTPIGRLLVVAITQIYGANPPRSITSVQDSVDLTNFTLGKSQVSGSGNSRTDIYYRFSTTAGTRTATVVLSGAGSASVAMAEYSGVTAFSSSSGASGTGTSATPGGITHGSTALFINVVGTTASYDTVTKDATYTERSEIEFGGPTFNMSDFAGTGTKNPTTTLSASAEWSNAQVSFT